MAKSSNPEGKTGVRIVVAGDRGTGKSSLIVTAAAETFPTNVPRLLPPTRLPEDFYPDRVPITIIDTSSNPEDRGKLAEELKRADAVVLTYACDQPETLNRLIGCKLDLRDDQQQVSLEQVMSPIMQQFREIETCIECSAYKHIQGGFSIDFCFLLCVLICTYVTTDIIMIPEVFYYAQKAVLHPTGPLFDQETQTLKPRCVRALKRIFILCDHDRDGALSDAELNNFQVKCFNAPLQPSEIVGVKRVVQDKLVEGVNERGLTLTGFLFLHALFIEKGRLETTWTVLRKFGYNNDIKLSDDLIPYSSFKRAPDQSVELTNEAIEFLKGVYELFDSDLDNNLRPIEVEDVFSTAPEKYGSQFEIHFFNFLLLDCNPTESGPWNDAPYKDAAEKTALGGLSLDAFLSEWALMTLLDPARSLENLIYIGYPGDSSSAIRITRRRRLDRKKQQSERNVFQCFVFGPANAGKSALMNSFLGRPYLDSYSPTADEQYAVNVVELPGGIKKTLVLREIPEDGVSKLLSSKESLAPCDIAVFVYDSSDESSWKRATELLMDVAGHGEDTGYDVPCLIVAAKDDLDSFPMAIQNSTRVSQDMGIEAPIPISSKLRDFNNIFRRIVNAAEHPHLSIPETEAGRSRKQYHRLINRSLMVVSVGAAVAIVGFAAYRVYAARKNASS
ncbi:hypothetical protein GOBAR_AA15914 [Gossypium barbadense]|uniref:Mitochondrial Rho GTPase n=1 Tax=Gossypium barbadense TaxID=3634 RepID=A0A2P5XN55_GOSBA|nr:hypothetical protein GOBAR_AA15914 [Gossypium barbadense]